MIIKGFAVAILLMLGPFMAMVIRMSGGNYSLIATIGLLFEAISILAVWFIIKNYLYNTTKEKEEPIKGKPKGKRAEPNL